MDKFQDTQDFLGRSLLGFQPSDQWKSSSALEGMLNELLQLAKLLVLQSS